jgi:hypothetical protein
MLLSPYFIQKSLDRKKKQLGPWFIRPPHGYSDHGSAWRQLVLEERQGGHGWLLWRRKEAVVGDGHGGDGLLSWRRKEAASGGHAEA